MKRMRKNRRQAGFTLAETLLAVLILLLVSSIVAAGIPVAQNAYEKVVLASNAQILMSTTVAALRDQLGTARNVRVASDGSVYYNSADTGAMTRLYLKDDNTIWVDEYANGSDREFFRESDSVAPISYQLITNAALDKGRDQNKTNLYIKYDGSPVYEKGIITFKGLKVYSKNTNAVLATLDDDNSVLKIRVFLADKQAVSPTTGPAVP